MKRMRSSAVVLLLSVVVAMVVLIACGRAVAGGATELGAVEWGRDLDAALAESGGEGKPVFLLFQEIPGCETCVSFGRGALSHPLMVEAIETEFVAVAIHNNKPGRDAEILARFCEPSWNNPVVRFLGPSGEDIIPRRDRIWSTGELAARMIEALSASGRRAPEYLRLVASESDVAAPERATFSMYCFWAGEACLGELDGVIASRAGWIDGKEAVEITFDPRLATYETILEQAAKRECADAVYAHGESQLAIARQVVGDRAHRAKAGVSDAKASDQKYQLRHSALRYLPLTPMQASRVNSALAHDHDPSEWLSPRQRELADAIRSTFAGDPDRFEGLSPPGRTAGLAAYELELRQRLAGKR